MRVSNLQEKHIQIKQNNAYTYWKFTISSVSCIYIYSLLVRERGVYVQETEHIDDKKRLFQCVPECLPVLRSPLAATGWLSRTHWKYKKARKT